MAPTCENNVQIKLTPKNFLQIYQYLGIFVLPETSACDINKALKSQSQKSFNERKYQYLKYKNKNNSGTDT
jgi:hypothetical protein